MIRSVEIKEIKAYHTVIVKQKCIMFGIEHLV
jgi:hypothetical protein